uniref:Uncharacterized protein n=1 Tax=Rhizophora mucronata TaxID=61149 RepID=A0A2P2QX44_RHIMU
MPSTIGSRQQRTPSKWQSGMPIALDFSLQHFPKIAYQVRQKPSCLYCCLNFLHCNQLQPLEEELEAE